MQKILKTSVPLLMGLIILASCTTGRQIESEPVPANRFFMMVLDIVKTEGDSLSITPIYEGWKEGRLKPFGPGPESDAAGYWRIDHLSASGELVGTEWVRDPMRGEYEYSEDGTTLERVSFGLQRGALAVRVPMRVHGSATGVRSVRVTAGPAADQPGVVLYEYLIKE